MSTVLSLLHANVCADRYDYRHTWPKRWPAFVKAVQIHDPLIVTLTECQQDAADALALLLRSQGMLAVSYLGSSILYASTQLQLTRVLERRPWLGGSQTHSLLAVEFKVRATGELFNVLVSHLPPFATRAKLRRTQQAQIRTLVQGWHDPVILATDANWGKGFEDFCAWWQSARLMATARHHADYRTSGGKWGVGRAIDYVLGKRVRFGSYDVLDGRKWSDHNALIVRAWL